MRKFLLFFLVLLFSMSGIFADGHMPAGIDGVLGANEYEWTKELRKANLFWHVEGDVLKIAMEAETSGWLAVGLGSARMDGSVMFMGYHKNGEAFFEEHLGKGHSHSKVENDRDVTSAVSETDGVTVMEFAVKKSDFLSAGNQFPVIVAYGSRDNFRSMHRYRDSTVFEF